MQTLAPIPTRRHLANGNEATMISLFNISAWYVTRQRFRMGREVEGLQLNRRRGWFWRYVRTRACACVWFVLARCRAKHHRAKKGAVQ
jgi:hypothetical protein